MPIVNPYAKSSKNLDSSPCFKVLSTSKDVLKKVEAADNALRNANVRVSGDVSEAPRHVTPPHCMPEIRVVTQNYSNLKKKKFTFQSQLRQQILDLKKKKRLKALEVERKILEDNRRAAAEAERKRKEDERKKKEEFIRRKEEEREIRREEEEKIRRLRAEQKLEKQRLQDMKRAEEQRIAIENSLKSSLNKSDLLIESFHPIQSRYPIPIMTNLSIPAYPSQYPIPYLYPSGIYSNINCGAFNPSFSYLIPGNMGQEANQFDLTGFNNCFSNIQQSAQGTCIKKGFTFSIPGSTPHVDVNQELKQFQTQGIIILFLRL
jgi:hypothetical protein